MTPHDVINEICTDLETANEMAETVGYGGWVTSENGTATVAVETYGSDGEIADRYCLSLTLTKES